jgi:hypothetical protein
MADQAAPVAAFLSARCQAGRGWVGNSELFEAFGEWARSSGMPAVGRKQFTRALLEAGFRQRNSRLAGGRFWRGLSLLPADAGAGEAPAAAGNTSEPGAAPDPPRRFRVLVGAVSGIGPDRKTGQLVDVDHHRGVIVTEEQLGGPETAAGYLVRRSIEPVE